MMVRLADEGKSFEEIAQAVEDRWHIEYPATNNAVANGGLVAVSVWFGDGDFQDGQSGGPRGRFHRCRLQRRQCRCGSGRDAWNE